MFILKRISRDKKVSERDSRQFFIAAIPDNRMRISATVMAPHMPCELREHHGPRNLSNNRAADQTSREVRQLDFKIPICLDR
jgi:hypothetical protein